MLDTQESAGSNAVRIKSANLCQTIQAQQPDRRAVTDRPKARIGSSQIQAPRPATPTQCEFWSHDPATDDQTHAGPEKNPGEPHLCGSTGPEQKEAVYEQGRHPGREERLFQISITTDNTKTNHSLPNVKGAANIFPIF